MYLLKIVLHHKHRGQKLKTKFHVMVHDQLSNVTVLSDKCFSNKHQEYDYLTA